MNNLKQKTIEKFENLKKRVDEQGASTNYYELTNIAIDYDNEAQDELYLYDLIQGLCEFVDDEILEDIITNEAKYGVARLRCFINNTYDADIYKLDGYGNLENVNDDDFIYCIDKCIDKLKEA